MCKELHGIEHILLNEIHDSSTCFGFWPLSDLRLITPHNTGCMLYSVYVAPSRINSALLMSIIWGTQMGKQHYKSSIQMQNSDFYWCTGYQYEKDYITKPWRHLQTFRSHSDPLCRIQTLNLGIADMKNKKSIAFQHLWPSPPPSSGLSFSGAV